jgi:hypothetical protein
MSNNWAEEEVHDFDDGDEDDEEEEEEQQQYEVEERGSSQEDESWSGEEEDEEEDEDISVRGICFNSIAVWWLPVCPCLPLFVLCSCYPDFLLCPDYVSVCLPASSISVFVCGYIYCALAFLVAIFAYVSILFDFSSLVASCLCFVLAVVFLVCVCLPVSSIPVFVCGYVYCALAFVVDILFNVFAFLFDPCVRLPA